MSLIYSNIVDDPAFVPKVIDVANTLQTDPNNLMLIMYQESGLNPQAQNTTYPIQGGYATGLIQFAPNTATNLGTTTDALMQMTAVQQMDYVEKYYAPYIGQIGTYEKMYLVNFFPAALSYSDDQCIGTASISCASVAASNPSFDLNGDGQITIAEFNQAIDAKLPLGYGSSTGRSVMAALAPVTDVISYIPLVGNNANNPIVAVLAIAIVITMLVIILIITKKVIDSGKGK